MANKYIMSADFLAPSAYLKSDEQTAFPASNINQRAYPFRPWKANSDIASGSHWVGVDLGVGGAVLPEAVMIDTINVTSINIQAASDATFTTDLRQTGALTVSKDFDQRYKLCQTDFTGFIALRYWRVLAVSTSTTDGSIYMSVGSFSVLGTAAELTRNLGQTYTEIFRKATKRAEVAGGGGPVIGLGNPYAQIELSSDLTLSGLSADLEPIIGLGQETPFLFFKNQGDSSQAYICRIAATVSRGFGNPGTMRVQSMLLEEVVHG